MNQSIKQVIVDSVDAQTIFAEFDKINCSLKEMMTNLTCKNNSETLLTRNEVIKLLKISFPTLHDWTRKGILKAYRTGNLVRYKESEVMTALIPISNKRDKHTMLSNNN